MKIPTILSSGDVNTGAVAPRMSFASAEAQAAGGRAIAGGLDEIASGMVRYNRITAERMKQRQEYDDHLWSEQKYTEAQRKMIQWTNDVQKNGSEDVVDQFNAVFPDYQKAALDQAPTTGARDRLKMKLDDLGTRVFDDSLKIEAVNRNKNTISTFGKMLDDSTDIIAQRPEAYQYEQRRLQTTLQMTIDQKRASPEVIQKIQDQINNLGANAAEAMIPRDPTYARVILNNVKGIDWSRRKTIEGEIDRASQTNSSLFHYEQQELAKSNFDSIIATGKLVTGFDVNTYAASFPVNVQAAAKKEVESQIEIAKQVYVGALQLKAKSPGQIQSTLATYAPKAGDAGYADKQQIFKHLQQVADQQQKLYEKDPFSYARQDPIVNAAWKMMEDLPPDTKPELRAQLGQQAMDVTVNYQKSIGVPEGAVSVMSNDMAKSTAAQINGGDTQAVQQTFQGMMKTYGKYYQNAFRDMARLPDGERIGADMQIVALHIGAPFLTDFIQASRTKMSDFKLEDGDAKVIREKLAGDGNFMAFSQALVAANPANVSYVDDFHQAISKYATSLYFRGKAKSPSDAVVMASDLILKSAYAFTEVGGSSIAIKKTQDFGTIDERDVGLIRSNLSNLSGTIAPESIDTRRFAFPQGISDAVRSQSISDTLRNDTFWSTNPQNDGVIMYMNGADGQVAPVMYKDGRKVEKKFKDLMVRGPEAPDIKYRELPPL